MAYYFPKVLQSREKIVLVAEKLRHLLISPLPASLESHVVVFGGCLRDLLAGDSVNDYDIVVDSLEAESALMSFFAGEGKAGEITERHANFDFRGHQVQIARKVYFPPEPQTVAFVSDFTICCAALTSKGFAAHPNFFHDLDHRILRINRIPFPLSTFERLQKLACKGYRADQPTLLALAKALAATDLEDPCVISMQFSKNPPGEGRMAQV